MLQWWRAADTVSHITAVLCGEILLYEDTAWKTKITFLLSQFMRNHKSSDLSTGTFSNNSKKLCIWLAQKPKAVAPGCKQTSWLDTWRSRCMGNMSRDLQEAFYKNNRLLWHNHHMYWENSVWTVCIWRNATFKTKKTCFRFVSSKTECNDCSLQFPYAGDAV